MDDDQDNYGGEEEEEETGAEEEVYDDEHFDETTPRSNTDILDEDVEEMEPDDNEEEEQNEEFEEEPVEDEDMNDVDISADQAVTVIVRIRPLLQDEEYTAEGEKASIAVTLPHSADQNKIRVVAKEGTQFESVLECGYDRVLNMDTTQTEVFESTAIKPAVLGVAHGISACIFAYGQTSSGKTHTMLGNDEYGRADKSDMESTNDIEWGVIPRSVAGLFSELDSDYAKQFENNHGDTPEVDTSPDSENTADNEDSSQNKKSKSSFQFTVYCSMLQIYNEQLHDLLSSSALYGEGEPLSIREVISEGNSSNLYDDNDGNKKNNTELYVQGLSSFRVSNVDDVLSLLKHGARCRAVRATELNEVSSRSHAILQLLVETQSKDENGVLTIRRAKLSMVDLAGSEKMNVAKDAPHMTKRHLQELTSINKSLSCLGNVIAVLADKSTGKIPYSSHVPYRDSKLTRLLQDSLGGTTRTVVVACVCPSSQHGAESISTLKFADRARRVMARVTANEVVDDSTLLARAKLEIKRLQKIINMLRAREAANGGINSGSGSGTVGNGRSLLNQQEGLFHGQDDDDDDDGNQLNKDNGLIDHNVMSNGKAVNEDIYNRQLRIDNLKLKEENRKLKEKCKKLKSLSSSSSSSSSSSKKSHRYSNYKSSGNSNNSSGYLDISESKQHGMGEHSSLPSKSYGHGESTSQRTLEELGKRVQNLEMKKKLDLEFNKPLLPLDFMPLLHKYEMEYSSKDSKSRNYHSGNGGSDDDEREGGGGKIKDEVDIQINILKSMNGKLNKNPSYHETYQDNRDSGGEDFYDTAKDEKMLEMLMSTHEQLRSDAYEEGDKLVSLRSEREELERQLKALNGRGGGGGGLPSAISEDDDDDDETQEEEEEVQSSHVTSPLFNKRVSSDDRRSNEAEEEERNKQSHNSSFLPPHVTGSSPTQSTEVRSAPHSGSNSPTLSIQHAGGVVRQSYSVDSNTHRSDHKMSSASSSSQRKKNKNNNNHTGSAVQSSRTSKRSQTLQEKEAVLSPSTMIKSEVQPLIKGGDPSKTVKMEADKHGLFHTTADVGVTLKLYSYRFDDYFDATIGDYDPNRKLHLCNYGDSGEKQWHDLSRKRLVVVSRPMDNVGDDKQSSSKTSSPRINKQSKQKRNLGNAKKTGNVGEPYYPPLSDSSLQDNKTTTTTTTIKMPPSIFGVRPNSSSMNRSRPPSASNQRPISREEANELLKNSPYLTDKSLI